MDPEKYAAIRKHLGTREYAFTEYADGTRGITQFQLLAAKGPSPMIGVTDEFVEDFSADEIVHKLVEWDVLGVATGAPEKLVLVTRQGVEIKNRAL